MSPQGTCTFAGSQALLSASFTLSHGVSPSVAMLYVAPQPGRFPERGSLVFRYGGASMVFPDCRLESLLGQIDASGREVWALSVADRRWKWKFGGCISGRYNVRRIDGRRGILPGTEKSPQDLARLCLLAMGERRFDVSRLPNGSRPAVDWDYDLPAEALARLCDALGCRVVLRLNNSVSLEPVGLGNSLPLGSDVLAGSQAAEPPPRPDALVLVCGRTRWQHDFRLEAVGLEADGTLQPINKLSYAPLGEGSLRDWRYTDVPHFQNVSRPEARGLARQSVFRYYRIAVPFALPGAGGKSESIGRIDRILPLGSNSRNQLDRPDLVYGVFHGGSEATQSESSKVEADVESKPRGLCTGDFSIDCERGLVIFAEPVYRYFDIGTQSTQRNLIAPAELWLRTWVALRDAQTGGWLRHEVERRTSGTRLSTPPRYVRRDDLALVIAQNHAAPNAGRVIDNRAAIEIEANRYLDAVEQDQRLKEPASVTYAGLKPLDLDGAINQITWTISPEGFATTRASRNREDATLGPTHKERRFVERLS